MKPLREEQEQGVAIAAAVVSWAAILNTRIRILLETKYWTFLRDEVKKEDHTHTMEH